ncbi:hypothetical protein F8S13_00230 [Chloroflexia bacterium SDU3-3]|nr:hypothetical protein F8S13_00230 [Chloroflexia bacterium SDU3-3]
MKSYIHKIFLNPYYIGYIAALLVLLGFVSDRGSIEFLRWEITLACIPISILFLALLRETQSDGRLSSRSLFQITALCIFLLIAVVAVCWASCIPFSEGKMGGVLIVDDPRKGGELAAWPLNLLAVAALSYVFVISLTAPLVFLRKWLSFAIGVLFSLLPLLGQARIVYHVIPIGSIDYTLFHALLTCFPLNIAMIRTSQFTLWALMLDVLSMFLFVYIMPQVVWRKGGDRVVFIGLGAVSLIMFLLMQNLLASTAIQLHNTFIGAMP